MFSKSPPINLVRAYVCPLPGNASVVLKDLLACPSWGGAEPVSKVSINYDAERELSMRRDLAKPMAYSDLECVLALSKSGEVAFGFSRQSHPAAGADVSPVFELMLVRPQDRSFAEEVKILAGLEEYFVPLFGYARTLGADRSPISETKVRRGILGGSSGSVPKRSEAWLMPDQAIAAGAIRGVYPVNYWSEQAYESIKRIGLKLPHADLVMGAASRFDEKQQKQILDDNPQFERHLHFGDV